MFAHSQIGPSAGHRWVPCPGSVAACRDYPNHSNVDAAQGTAAHTVAEDCLRNNKDADTWLGKVLKVEEWEFEVDREMVNGVQLYLDVVRNDAKELGIKRAGDILVENLLSGEKIHPDLFGTNDAALVATAKKKLKGYDLKYGRNTVEARENTQLLIYAVMLLLEYDPDREIEEVEMVIVQPRVSDPVKRWTVTREYIQKFAKKLKAAALATEDPNAPRVPGEKQCEWCAHKPNCPEAREFAFDKAMVEFDDDGDLVTPDPDEMGDNALAEVLRWVPFIKKYLQSVETEALRKLEHGEKVPGFKLVEKRPSRKWADPEDAVKRLMEMGLDEEDIFSVPSILSPAQMEKHFTKELAQEMNDKLVVRESSGTKIVPEDDPAPEVSAGAAVDFAED
jgi:hypothetical protein